MDLFNPNSKIYLLCKSIKNNIYVYGGDFEIYAVFDFKGQFITYSEVNCFNTLKASIYKTTILSLYLYLIIECYKEFDFFLIKTIEKRNLLNYSVTAPQQETNQQTVLQAFHLLNNFDIPVGIQFPMGEAPADVPSATQFTVISDTQKCLLYYRTMYNSNIRCIDLKDIDFENITYQSHPLDATKQQPIEMIQIK